MTQAAKAKIPKTETIVVYAGKFVELWRTSDTEGELSIKLGKEIRKRWNAEAKIEAKKAKTEAEVSHENE